MSWEAEANKLRKQIKWFKEKYQCLLQQDIECNSFTQIQADWLQEDFEKVDFIKNKPIITPPTGLEFRDNIGWRLIGHNFPNYGPLGEKSVDFSSTGLFGNGYGATGDYAFTLGREVTGSGDYSFSGGFGNISSGLASFTYGTSNFATALNAVALNGSTTSSGINSTSLGLATEAQNYAELAIGINNTRISSPSNDSATVINPAFHRLFVIGDGEGSGAFQTPGDIISVWGNQGLVIHPKNINSSSHPNAQVGMFRTSGQESNFIAEVYDGTGWRNLISSGTATGLEAIDEGNGIGWRLIGRNSNNYGNIGKDAIDFSTSPSASTTFGATGLWAFAQGIRTTASGNHSLAFNTGTLASGTGAVAFGFNTIVESSFGFGIGTGGIVRGAAAFVAGSGNENFNPSEAMFGIGASISNDGSFTNGSAYKGRLFVVGDAITLSSGGYAERTEIISAYANQGFIIHPKTISTGSHPNEQAGMIRTSIDGGNFTIEVYDGASWRAFQLL